MQHTLISIKDLSQELLKENITKEEIKNTIDAIYNYFKTITSISGYDQELKNLAAVPTASGMALGLNHAAQCLLDYQRTYLLFNGVVKAIKNKQKEYPNQTIHLFYAGCGPYAPLMTLVAPLFKSEELHFSLLEINSDAIEYSKKIIQNLELENYIDHYFVKDAVTFKIPNPEKYHILYSETLDALLYRECYVPILGNLIPQLNDNTEVIPNNVVLNFSGTFIDTTEELIDCVFDTRKSIEKHKLALPEQFPSKEIEFNQQKNYRSVIIDTLVHVYDDLWIKRGESSLTLPYEMHVEQPIDFKKVIFTYQTKPSIELKLSYQ